MVSPARYWRPKRVNAPQCRVSWLIFPNRSFHVSAVSLCYKKAAYSYLGHLSDCLKKNNCHLVSQIIEIWKLFLDEQSQMLAGKFITEQEGKFTADLEHLRDAMSCLFLLIFSNTHSSAPYVSCVSHILCFHILLYFASSTDPNRNFRIVFYAKVESDCMKW